MKLLRTPLFILSVALVLMYAYSYNSIDPFQTTRAPPPNDKNTLSTGAYIAIVVGGTVIGLILLLGFFIFSAWLNTKWSQYMWGVTPKI